MDFPFDLILDDPVYQKRRVRGLIEVRPDPDAKDTNGWTFGAAMLDRGGHFEFADPCTARQIEDTILRSQRDRLFIFERWGKHHQESKRAFAREAAYA